MEDVESKVHGCKRGRMSSLFCRVNSAVLLLSQTFVFSARKNRVCFTFLLSSQTVNCMWRMLHLVLAGPAQTVAPE